jgi:hypothetical protein
MALWGQTAAQAIQPEHFALSEMSIIFYCPLLFFSPVGKTLDSHVIFSIFHSLNYFTHSKEALNNSIENYSVLL